MMAVGLSLFLVGYTVMELDLSSQLVIPDWICNIGVFCLLTGFLLMIAGTITWLWKVAP
jgi:hypothetical protein